MEWNNCRFGWGVPPIHMRCVMEPERDTTGEWTRVRREWGSAWEEKRAEMLKQLATVLLGSNVACVGAVADAAHFRKMPDSKWKKSMQNPLFLCFHSLLMDSLDKIDTISTSLPVSIIVDDDPQYAMKCYEAVNSMKSQLSKMRERLVAVTFGDDRQYPGLQMADMIAFEARTLMVKRLTEPKAEPSALYIALTKKCIHQPKFWNAECLDRLAQSGAVAETAPS